MSLRDRLSALRTPFVVTTAVALVACGGESDVGGAGGSAGSSTAGAGGTGQGGSGGSYTHACPTDPPRYLTCPGVGPGTTCEYPISCHSGEQTIRFTCGDRENWQAGGTACANPYDYCADADVECVDGQWSPRLEAPGVGNPPPPCPEEKPSPGAICEQQTFERGSPTCGYPCPNGTDWTVGSCYHTSPVWAFDGACAGDCSNADLLHYVAFQRSCVSTADCKVVMTSGCSSITDHCSGAFYVSQAADEAQIQQLDQALTQCQQSGGCATCDEPAPPVACIGGRCAPAVSD